MNKTVFTVFLTTSILFAGCTKDQINVTEPDQKTIEQAMLDSGIAPDNIIFTEEIKGQNAFSIYEQVEGFGVTHYVKSDKGWQYRGGSEFGHPAGDPEPLSFGVATWLLGDYSLDGNSRYNTVFLGEIHQPEISKIILEVNHGKYTAKIISSNSRKFWYHQSGIVDAQSLVTKISGYNSNGKLIFEKNLNLNEQ
ncbi:hypothetical protein [Mesobacillus jeotgali]|uniref:Lipoprotein n=1 Tax=Mesobacillus jeotgali TaxID=129985 RepID=A0ABY9VBA8_9BACI|nr:hypothetical protein [Mesobacillus jeotgali]WNF21178.1 hypothetical protein RH061_13295 [Mesobacillus jeotgali]